MIRPTKYSHPDKTVVYLTVQLLKHIKKQRIDSYDNVLSYGKEKVDGASFLFSSALDLLFLLGLIDYHAKNDSFEYVGP